MVLKFIDLFAGVGGFRYGLESVNRGQNRQSQENTKKDDEKGQRLESKERQKDSAKKRQSLKHANSSPKQIKFTCVYSNEWDKYASSVYRRKYGECDQTDITKVKAEKVPDHDLLCGGFPCQSFSVAGKRGGFNDTRGTLFFDIARILKEKRPRYLLLENVKGLLSHDKGKTFQTMLGVLSDLGYGVQWQVLNSKNFGVPQNRERVFVVGHLREKSRPKVFPIFGQNSKTLKYVTGGGIDKWLEDGKNNSRNHSQGQRVYSTDGIASTQSAHGGGWGAKTGLYAIGVQGDLDKRKTYLKKDMGTLSANPTSDNTPRIAIPVLTPEREKKRQRGRRFKTSEEPAFTITGQDRHGVYDGMKIRRLTPVECERLQGFPDNWTKYEYDGQEISDTQRYKMMGNAVSTPVITAVGERLLKSIDTK